MPITEELMDPGSWSVQLQDDVPLWVLEDIDVRSKLWSTIVVTPHHFRVGDISDANLLAAARYSGVFLGMGEGRRSLYGKGLAWWLGDQGEGGDLHAGIDFNWVTDTFTQAITDLVFNGSNGLTQGTVSVPSTSFEVNLEGGDTKREVLDTLINQSSATTMWQITPGGVVNINAATTLWPTQTTPTTVMTSKGGREGSVYGIPAQISVDELAGDEVRHQVYVDWDDGNNSGVSTLSPIPWYDFAGASPEVRHLMDWRPKRPKPPTERWRKVAAWQIRSETQANQLAARELNERSEVRNHLTISIAEYDPWRFSCSPGNGVYVLEPDAQIQDLTKSVQFQGEVIHPEVVRVNEWTTPIQEGYGVYLRYWNGASMTYYDLTEWVDWELDDTTLKLGHRDRFAPEVSPKRMSKLKKKLIRRAAQKAFTATFDNRNPNHLRNPPSLGGPGFDRLPPPVRPRR
jgi:hypothetical protein